MLCRDRSSNEVFLSSEPGERALGSAPLRFGYCGGGLSSDNHQQVGSIMGLAHCALSNRLVFTDDEVAMIKRIPVVAAGFLAFLLIGCGGPGTPSVLPNSDPYLNDRTSAQFAADAAKRTFPADAPRGDAKEAPVRAQVRYWLAKEIEIVNLSKTQDYKDVELWLNRKYVVFLPKMEKDVLKVLNFNMIYDRDGNFFTVSKEAPRIERMEMVMGGKVYEVPTQLAD